MCGCRPTLDIFFISVMLSTGRHCADVAKNFFLPKSATCRAFIKKLSKNFVFIVKSYVSKTLKLFLIFFENI